MITRRATLIGSLAGAVTAQTLVPRVTGETMLLPDPTETIDLWPGDAPGLPSPPPQERTVERSIDPRRPDRAVTGITRPRLVVFRPARANGSALLVAPGGGYARVVVDKEGFEMGRLLSARGWTVFVLFYRLPGEGWADRADVALADAQRAMRLIRARAGHYGIEPARVGAMGFSAGGHVCADLATRHAASVYRLIDAADALPAKPLAAAPIYAVQAMDPALAHPGSRELLLGPNPSADVVRAHSPAANVTAATPPIFMVHAEDDRTVPPANSVVFREACKAAGVPVELHLFAEGGHGFGVRGAAGKPVALWPALFAAWAKTYGLG
ncbi:alpha/beta hydrolase [Sphingomonas sp.]|uniref:alpha/beta hydrolase n=1 Tax=Sphingomonas sp. TaxID=28214 RepID=UPI003CC52ABC